MIVIIQPLFYLDAFLHLRTLFHFCWRSLSSFGSFCFYLLSFIFGSAIIHPSNHIFFSITSFAVDWIACFDIEYTGFNLEIHCCKLTAVYSNKCFYHNHSLLSWYELLDFLGVHVVSLLVSEVNIAFLVFVIVDKLRLVKIHFLLIRYLFKWMLLIHFILV